MEYDSSPTIMKIPTIFLISVLVLGLIANPSFQNLDSESAFSFIKFAFAQSGVEETVGVEDELQVSTSMEGEEEPSEVEETVGVEDELQVSTSMREVMSPLKQMKSGVDPKDVVCKEGFVLMLKSTDGSAACVKDLSSSKLIERGWGILA